MLAMFVGWKLLKRTKFVKLHEMDLETDTYPADRVDPKQEKSGWKQKAYHIWRWIL